MDGVRVGNDGCIGCIADAETKGLGAIGVIEAIVDDTDVDDEELNAEVLKDVEGTRVAPSPGPGRFIDDLVAWGLSELGTFGEEGRDCVCCCCVNELVLTGCTGGIGGDNVGLCMGGV